MMDVKEMPPCMCGEGEWRMRVQGAGAIQRTFALCTACSRLGAFMAKYAGGNLFLNSKAPYEFDENNYDYRLTGPIADWFNTCVMPVWKIKAAAYEEDYDNNPGGGWFLDFDPPPRIPVDLVVVYWDKKPTKGPWNWEKVNPLKTANDHIPEDPTRTNHVKFFEGVFEAVGLSDRARVEIPNQYMGADGDPYNLRPWYQLRIGEFVVTIGPRKRVISMKMQRKDNELFNVYPIQALAKRDCVTYEADGSWQSEKDEARSVLIHAYGQEKTIEYLGELFNIALPILDRIVEATSDD